MRTVCRFEKILEIGEEYTLVEDDPESEGADGGEENAEDRDDAGFIVDDEGNVESIGSSDASGPFGGSGGGFGGFGYGGPFRRRDRFVLTPAAFWSRPLRLLLLIAGIIFFANVLPNVFSSGLTLWRLIGLVGLPLAAAIGVAYRAWKLPKEPLEIVCGDEYIDMPKGADNPARVEVDYRDIRSLLVMARGESEILLLETEKHRFALSDRDFREPNGPRLLKDEIMRRIRNHPKHRSILERMRLLEEHARAASGNPTSVTYALIGSIVVGYVIQHVSGAWSSQFGLLQLGANSAPLVADGQWWRLVSANFLHGNFLHIFLNGIALLFLGISIERLIGSWRFLLIYLVTAVGGAAGSYLWTDAPLSVGASTALYGLVGAFGVLHVRYWKEIPPPYRQTVKWWVFILGINFALSALPAIDAAAHFVGMGVGVVLTFAVLLPLPTLDPTRDASIWIKVAAAAMTAVFAAGIAQASNYAQHDHPEDAATMVRGMAERGREAEEPSQLNQAAWMAATWRDAPAHVVRSAREASEEAIEIAEEREAPESALVQYRDTLATVRYRLGMKAEGEERREHLEEAIQIEREVVRSTRSLLTEGDWLRLPRASDLTQAELDQFRAQLIRFLEAYESDFSQYVVGEPFGDRTTVRLEEGRGALALEVTVGGRTPAQAQLIAVVGESRTVGAFSICLPADAKGGVIERFSSGETPGGIDSETPIRLVMTDAKSPDCVEGENSSTFWPLVRGIRELP